MSGHQDILVMGDNHGDVESLDRVIADTKGQQFDFIIHVGDLTNAWFDGIETGVEQLRAVESRLEDLADQADEGLLYIYRNRDHTRGPESEYVYARYELDVGTHIPVDGATTISGQRFTQDPELVTEDDILVTHGEYVAMLDHFDARAYFSGHEHTGRYKGRYLNSAFLYRTDDHGSEPLIGGYFVVTVDDEPPFEIDFRNLDRLQKLICHKHHERGVLFAPDFHDCQFCYDNQQQLMQEMVQSAFYGITHQNDQDAVSETGLVEYAVGLFDSPPNDFERKFTQYVNELGQHPLDLLHRDDNDRLVRPTN
jgi:hypothetical protein